MITIAPVGPADAGTADRRGELEELGTARDLRRAAVGPLSDRQPEVVVVLDGLQCMAGVGESAPELGRARAQARRVRVQAAQRLGVDVERAPALLGLLMHRAADPVDDLAEVRSGEGGAAQKAEEAVRVGFGHDGARHGVLQGMDGGARG
ncbi:hypothetical protein ABT093_39120 [Kitasatospora sp. NPDC002551]|uniref:hypothetical protein n=1 Tax=Kitasatospora sp. NPDC002551 TaxID=3154539 RepID=UPI00331E1920